MSQSAVIRQNAPGKLAVKKEHAATATIIGSLAQVTKGSVLIRPGTALPAALRLPLRRLGHWNLIADLSASELDRLVRNEEWHLFFLVPAVESSRLGLSPHSAFQKALRDVVRQVEARDFNALEVADVRVRSLMNLHYVRITAYPRHVRNSPFLRDLNPHHRVGALWNSLRIFEVRNRKVKQAKRI
jgi:hypothetical protein